MEKTQKEFFVKQQHLLSENLEHANKLLQEYKKAVDESTIFSIGDTKGKILYANKQFCRVSGYTLEELVGQPHSIVRDPQMPKEAFKQMWETIQSKKVWKGTVVNRTKDGNRYYVEATIVPILDENGIIIEYAGIRNDITKLVLKEKELAVLKDQQRSLDVEKALEIKTIQLLHLIPFPSIMVDALTLEITHSNSAFEDLFCDSSMLDRSTFLSDLLLQQDDYVFEDDFLSLLQRYELMMPFPKAAIEINGENQEFLLGLKELHQGYVITFVQRG